MKKGRLIILVGFLVILTANAVYSQILLYPRGARNIGMGRTGAADLVNPVSGYYNPAALAWTNGIFIDACYQELVDVYSYTDARVSARMSGERGRNDCSVGCMVCLGLTLSE